jgi:hypothetical protein
MKKLLHKPYRLTVKVAKKITDFDQVFAENQNLKLENNKITLDNNEKAGRLKSLEKDYNFGWPKGHYYSPVHSTADLKHYKKVVNRSKSKFADTIPGFSEKRILKEFNDIKPYFKDFDYPKSDDGNCRFYSENPSYPLLDALVLFSMIRKNNPKRIIEIGSGFTSGLMMEVNEKYFGNKIDITFIEPYPQLLYQRMRKGDKSRYKVIPNGVQDVPLNVFKQLKKDDILFIDSTHVSKFNSDVNYEIFDILPELNTGVIIHFHDILDSFDYPLPWLQIGWAWNEAYLLRAYLMNNNEYEILIFNQYLAVDHSELLKKSYSKKDNLFGGSLWIRKL